MEVGETSPTAIVARDAGQACTSTCRVSESTTSAGRALRRPDVSVKCGLLAYWAEMA